MNSNSSDSAVTSAEVSESKHFIERLIESDYQKVVGFTVITRFPPEPNGYLHIGHAKSICLNFGMAEKFQGRCHLRMDDTNPEKEEVEYEESIRRDVEWMGFEWYGNVRYASDYFPILYQLAEELISAGHAYVCELSPAQVREYRGTLTQPGRASPFRSRTVEENLQRFRAMKAGEVKEGVAALRAKIDMASPNINLRDPVLYRVKFAHHHRTKDQWCIYPTYDY
ncbi:MAG: glutamate--tRNA ligase family protein, partial [Pseudomonadota bacterium]